MFADVSGFAALSEHFQNQNNEEGAKNLTIIINTFFARMLEILADCDGMLLKFAGDALLAFFPANDETTIELYTHALKLFPNEKSIRIRLERLENAQPS